MGMGLITIHLMAMANPMQRLRANKAFGIFV
jgi:hypothetical protein